MHVWGEGGQMRICMKKDEYELPAVAAVHLVGMVVMGVMEEDLEYLVPQDLG